MQYRGNKRGDPRGIVIAICAMLDIILSAALVRFHGSLGMGGSIAIGYAILLISAVLMNALIAGSPADTRRTVLLVFTLCILILILSAITYMLFSSGGELVDRPEDEEASSGSAAEAEAAAEEVTVPPAASGAADEYPPPVEEGSAPSSSDGQEMLQQEPRVPSAPVLFNTISGLAISDPSAVPADIQTSQKDEAGTAEGIYHRSPAIIASDDEEKEGVESSQTSGPEAAGTPAAAMEEEALSGLPAVPGTAEEPALPVSPEAVEEPVSPAAEAAMEAKESVSPGMPEEGAEMISAETALAAEEPVAAAAEDLPAEDSAVQEEVADGLFAGLSPEEAAFWESFYIEGEDSLELADGEYYMDLYINEIYTGTITVSMRGGMPYLAAGELEGYLSGTVTEDVIARLFHTGESFISLDYIRSQSIECSFDSVAYEIDMRFSLSDMPVQILSLRGTSRSGASRPLAGATILEPAAFTITSDYSLTARVNEFVGRDIRDELSFYFTADNEIRLYDLNLELDYYFDFPLGSFTADVSRYRFYIDFEDIMARLSWGNISTSLLSPAGRAVGIRFETDPYYGSPEARNSRSYIEQMLVVEKRSDVQIFNEGREIFRRTLAPGVYRLRDFVLYSGANRIRIVVTPLDGSEVTETEMDVMYSSSLLAPGEAYFNVSLATGRERLYSGTRRNAPGEVYIPFGDYTLRYDARNITLSSEIEAGLMESLGMNASLSVQNLPSDEASFRPNGALALEFTHVNVLGTTRYSLNLRETSDIYGNLTLPSFNASIGHQVSTDWNAISSVTFGASYIAPDEWKFDRYNPLSLNLSMSGRFGFFSWGLSAYGTIPLNNPHGFSWSVSGSFGLYIASNFSISGSIGISDSAYDRPDISGRISATYRFGAGSVSATAGFDEAEVSMYARSNKHYFRADVNSRSYTDPDHIGAEAGYSYYGDLFDVNFDFAAESSFRNIRGSATVSTSTIFADGVFTMASSVPSNYLLIRQYGSLKGNDLFVGSAGSSSTRAIPSLFETGMYTGVSVSNATNVGIFSSGENVFGGTASYSLSMPYSSRTGYVLRLHGDNVFAASGEVILPDGTPWLNGASPVYEVADGNLEATDDYLFTDSDGRFTVTGFEPGMYAFDVPFGREWILFMFTIEDTGDYSRVQIFESTESVHDTSFGDAYSMVNEMEYTGNLDEDGFFSMIYPEEAV